MDKKSTIGSRARNTIWTGQHNVKPASVSLLNYEKKTYSVVNSSFIRDLFASFGLSHLSSLYPSDPDRVRSFLALRSRKDLRFSSQEDRRIRKASHAPTITTGFRFQLGFVRRVSVNSLIESVEAIAIGGEGSPRPSTNRYRGRR